MTDSFGELARRAYARRAAREILKREMEEAASGLSPPADPTRLGVASEDEIQGNDDEPTARPPGEAFYPLQAPGAADLDRDHGNMYPERRNSACIDDVRILGGDASQKEIGHLYFDNADEEIIHLDDAPGIDFAPNLSGDFSSDEKRAVRPLGLTIQEAQGLQYRKKYCLGFALMLSFAGIALAAILATGKNAGEVDVKFRVKNPKYHPTPEQNPTETSTYTTHDLSAYGYPYAQKTLSSGWVTWLPGRRYKGEDPNHVSHDPNHVSYNANAGISSLEDCVVKCQETKAPTGSWSGKYKACWCNFSAVKNLCREPCAEDEYIDFATVPIVDIHYCKFSVCDMGWFLRDSEYCEVDVGFDQDACDVKKEEIERAAALTPTHVRT